MAERDAHSDGVANCRGEGKVEKLKIFPERKKFQMEESRHQRAAVVQSERCRGEKMFHVSWLVKSSQAIDGPQLLFQAHLSTLNFKWIPIPLESNSSYISDPLVLLLRLQVLESCGRFNDWYIMHNISMMIVITMKLFHWSSSQFVYRMGNGIEMAV